MRADDWDPIRAEHYLREVIGDLEATVAPCKIHFDAPEKIQIAADRAILVGLITNELVSNAGKYAYPDCPGGLIEVRIVQTEKNAILISVRDEGVGLPAQFDPSTSKRLGTRLVKALSVQLGAELTRPSSPIGTSFTLLSSVLSSSPDIWLWHIAAFVALHLAQGNPLFFGSVFLISI